MWGFGLNRDIINYMKFNLITIFPKIIQPYFGESILKKAQEKGLIKIEISNPRDFSKDKHKKVDDTPYGGGAGMVMKVQPIFDCLASLKKKKAGEKVRTILFSAKGKKYTQKDAKRLSEYDRLILICGRYEGVDERVAKNIVDEEISIGEYVLTGGEIPAMILVDSVSRLIPGVLGNPKSLEEESFNQGILEYPQYTKPEEFKNWKVPRVLLSGNHEKIARWRKKHSQEKK